MSDRKHENSCGGYANRYDCRKGMDCPCWCHHPVEAPAPARPTQPHPKSVYELFDKLRVPIKEAIGIEHYNTIDRGFRTLLGLEQQPVIVPVERWCERHGPHYGSDCPTCVAEVNGEPQKRCFCGGTTYERGQGHDEEKLCCSRTMHPIEECRSQAAQPVACPTAEEIAAKYFLAGFGTWDDDMRRRCADACRDYAASLEARVLAIIHKANPDDEYETIQEGIEAIISERNLAVKNEAEAEAKLEAAEVRVRTLEGELGERTVIEANAIDEMLEQVKRADYLAASLREVQEWLPWIQSVLVDCRDEFKVCEEDVCGHPSEARFRSMKEQCGQAATRLSSLLTRLNSQSE